MDKSTIKSINDNFQLFFVCLPEGVFFSTSAKAFGERYQHSDGAFHDSQLRLRRASQAALAGTVLEVLLVIDKQKQFQSNQ